MNTNADVIIVGGGHAGIEAAYAAATMGSKTILITLDSNKIATMPCNPSIGGLGKGHIVFEISALGGLMPQLCTTTYLQARMLNTKKGPAVQGLRLQIDKYAYNQAAVNHLRNTKNLTIIDGMVTAVITEPTSDNGKRITGVQTATGDIYHAPCVVITAGTFLSGLIHVGRTRYLAGRRGEAAVYGLSASLATAMGIQIKRLKTGTPPRLVKSSLDYTQFEQQPNEKLDFLYEFDHVATQEKIPCFVTQTNERTHEIIRSNLALSALYSGNIKGVGPRYCPSIEDKVGRYPDRAAHHVFIEPEGEGVDEIYPAGLSTSLPLSVQQAYINSIKGFERAVIAKCGYAIEYDCIQPTNLTASLEAKTVSGLFFAGQINGTTGYEEAAGQGLMAGINAHLKQAGKAPFILKRTESYIGVMIDDLITLGADEPYRMFTSRAERRLLLRQDNVFIRLMPYGRQLGLINDELYQQFEIERTLIQTVVQTVKDLGITSPVFKVLHGIDFNETEQQQAIELLQPILIAKKLNPTALTSRALLCIHAEIKYDGYLQKEQFEAEKALRYSNLLIPAQLEYTNMPGLTKELQQKLIHYRPQSIAQAQLIPGMTPAAISILIFQSRSKIDN
jgi:tRNA uridine 5-carboxymethylaminomethyl modification enzyme